MKSCLEKYLKKMEHISEITKRDIFDLFRNGLEINELPVLTTRSKDILQPGMTFAFEPKFVLAGIGAVGIENTFLVTDSGVEKMTLLDENIIEL